MRFVIPLAVVCALAPAEASARCLQTAGVSLFASADARHGFKLTRTGGVTKESVGNATASSGRLYTFDIDGRERVVWERRMMAVHGSVLIGPSKFVAQGGRYVERVPVVALGPSCPVGTNPVLTLYGPDGTLVADYDLEELLSKDELTRVPVSSVGRHWLQGGSTSFDAALHAFAITLSWGRVIHIDLETGRMVPDVTVVKGKNPLTPR